MTVQMVRNAFLWCFIINTGLLLWWFLMFSLARDWIYRMHGRWYSIPEDRFDSIHYTGIMIFKIAIFMFNLVPYIALCIVG